MTLLLYYAENVEYLQASEGQNQSSKRTVGIVVGFLFVLLIIGIVGIALGVAVFVMNKRKGSKENIEASSALPMT